jgi:hypothetical protein
MTHDQKDYLIDNLKYKNSQEGYINDLKKRKNEKNHLQYLSNHGFFSCLLSANR